MSETANNMTTKRSGGLMSRRRKKKKIILKDGQIAESVSGSYLRMQKDLNEIEWPNNVKLTYKSKELSELNIEMDVTNGYWKGGQYNFKFDIPKTYPIDAPKVLCVDKIYHPNIDLEGHICVSVLKGGWKPIYTIQTIVFALLFLFSNPNPNDPLNVEAAEDMRENINRFSRNVKDAMLGRPVKYKDKRTNFPRNKGLRR